jgi:DNA polymerase-4
MNKRVIWHIDMNAFFASVEEILNPLLKDVPFVVCNDSNKSVVSACNYLAKSLGIQAGEPLFKAKQIKRDIRTVDIKFEEYEKYSALFFKFVKNYLKNSVVEVASIDECYIDVTNEPFVNDVEQEALKLQLAIKREIGIGTSIGISDNKYYAKMGSDYKKPMGITLVNKDNFAEKFYKLDVSKILFIGKKKAKILKENGIDTIGDFMNDNNRNLMIAIVGDHAYSTKFLLQGQDTEEVSDKYSINKSISCARTLVTSINDDIEIREAIEEISKILEVRLQEIYCKFFAMNLTFKYSNFSIKVKSSTYEKAMNFNNIKSCAIAIYEKMEVSSSIRMVSISLNKLSPITNEVVQININESLDFNKQKMESIKKSVNSKYKKEILKFAKE